MNSFPMKTSCFASIYRIILSLLLLLPTTYFGLSKDIYVAKNGNDGNTGTITSPYLTISKAAQEAVAGDNVFIREGVYEETLVPSNSGTAGSPITFQGYQNEKVVITAMQALSGFTSDGGSRYKKTVDWDLGQRNFVMQGQTAMDLARWPNNTDGDRFTLNSLRNDGGSQDEVTTNAFLTDAEIPNWDWSNGGSVMFYGDRPGSGWTTWRAWIKNESQGRIDFDAIKNQSWIISAHPPGDKGDYFLEGIKEALDYENEWYFNSNTKTLYVILPNGAAPQDGEVQMARRELTINLNNRNYIHVKNLAVFGGSISIKGTGNTLFGLSSFYGSMTRGITPNFNSGVNAVSVDWAAVNTTIEKCEIGFGDGSGVWDSGVGTTIKNCYIHDFDMLGSYDAPLMVRGQNGAKILNNKVTRGGRDGLQIISKGSEVAYNDFSYSNLIADDCALLYTIGANLNMEIHHNWFHDAEGRGGLKKAAGIYLDNDAGNVRVYRNVVWNVEWTNVQINWNGKDIDIFNNTLVKADGGTMGAWHKAGTQFTNVKVWNNITDVFAEDQGGNQETEGTWEPQSDKQNNLVSKESFVDWANDDFHLLPSSEAVDYGRVISGYTEGFVGANPDVGAYELGDNWVPGVDWDTQSGPADRCYGLPGESCGGIMNPTESIAFSNQPTSVTSETSYDISMSYTVAVARDLIAVIASPAGTWLAEKRMTVQAGTGIETLTVNVDPALPIADDYVFRVIIREVGGDWSNNVLLKEVLVDVVEPFSCPDTDEYNECFESGIYDWGGWGAATKEVQSEVVNSGNYALKVAGLGASNYTIVGLLPNTSYTLSAFAKIDGSDGVNFGVKEFDAVNTDRAEFTTNASFEQKTIVFSTDGTHTSAQVYLYSPSAGGVGYLDDLKLVRNTVTELEEFEKQPLTVYPNPTTGEIVISKSTNWSLLNLHGALCKEGRGNQIELSELTNGIYFLYAENEVLRVVKE